ncbi:S-adenosyl-L-methionine-dependent methyltransferase [Thozetella sp. PMI_491]|nr:S-adenosyl-L-methionine-dependent methyltransferase [Thozetella sp. PMI_491]
MASSETQAESAVRMYESRAEDYDDSWHPNYSERLIAEVPIQRGDAVLSLCCGTGLDAFLAAEGVGETGRVVGVDITPQMLAKAEERKESDAHLGPRLKFLLHDVTDLDSLDAPEVQKGAFDLVICSNAFVLFSDPAGVVRHWKSYLKPGGRVAIDIAHEHNMRAGSIMETVAGRLGVDFPADRSWVKSRESFREILEQEGFAVESITELEKFPGKRSTYFPLDQADAQYDYVARSTLTAPLFGSEFKEKAREIFKEEFAKKAVDGKVEVVDSLYLYVAKSLSS